MQTNSAGEIFVLEVQTESIEIINGNKARIYGCFTGESLPEPDPAEETAAEETVVTVRENLYLPPWLE